jgi:diguanylate cyclase (GGDEF)-like protein/PAS domain S-box-containing protein
MAETIEEVIICVDDEWEILRSLGSQLKRNFGKEYQVELVDSGEEVIEICRELTDEGKDIPVIISDQKMRGMKGDTLLVQLHSLYPKTLKIMLTGQTDAKSVANVVNSAALYRYIAKPWDEGDLILTVTEALRRFQQDRQLAEQNESLRKINARLESSLSLLSATLEATADGILALDNEGNIASFNQKFLKLWRLSDLNEKNSIETILAVTIEKDAIEFQRVIATVDRQKRDYLGLKNGKIIEYHLQPQTLSGKILGKVLSFRDVTEEKLAEALVKHQSTHDALTNIPNRISFEQKFSAALSEAANNFQPMALMFVDLDRFKEVNDTLGHFVGDLLLQSVVRRISGCLRDSDVLGRWGGDEFVLLLDRIRCRQDASDIAQRIVRVLQPEFILSGHCITVTASIGIAIYPQDGADCDSLFRNADAALYRSKNTGKNNYQHFGTD